MLRLEVPEHDSRSRAICGPVALLLSLGVLAPTAEAAPEVRRVTAIIRDFTPRHPDFESTNASDRGIVRADLAPVRKPKYAHPGGTTVSTHGEAPFEQWFRDVPGVNERAELTLDFVRNDPNAPFRYDNSNFFPIDNHMMGNEGLSHNFHFTLELHTRFKYRGGETFRFAGDDDLFVFINGRLAIDLGGIHGEQSQDVHLDARANELGLRVGESYTLDLFFAERHTWGSDFRVETSIDLEQEPEEVDPMPDDDPPPADAGVRAEPSTDAGLPRPNGGGQTLRTIAAPDGCGCSLGRPLGGREPPSGFLLIAWAIGLCRFGRLLGRSKRRARVRAGDPIHSAREASTRIDTARARASG